MTACKILFIFILSLFSIERFSVDLFVSLLLPPSNLVANTVNTGSIMSAFT